jgi:hypothetical protein
LDSDALSGDEVQSFLDHLAGLYPLKLRFGRSCNENLLLAAIHDGIEGRIGSSALGVEAGASAGLRIIGKLWMLQPFEAGVAYFLPNNPFRYASE